jgi:hypothetical protein
MQHFFCDFADIAAISASQSAAMKNRIAAAANLHSLPELTLIKHFLERIIVR